MSKDLPELGVFLEAWKEDRNNVKSVFMALYESLLAMPGVDLEYHGRPGITHSLRGLAGAAKRPLFVLVDVIDDEPENRWLSVCFYADLVLDPNKEGDLVPSGLIGEDAMCFSIENPDDKMTKYVLDRLEEAHNNAKARL